MSMTHQCPVSPQSPSNEDPRLDAPTYTLPVVRLARSPLHMALPHLIFGTIFLLAGILLPQLELADLDRTVQFAIASALLPLGILLWASAACNLLLRLEFTADERRLWRHAALGPFRWSRGYLRAEILGTSPRRLLAGTDSPQAFYHLALVLRTGRWVWLTSWRDRAHIETLHHDLEILLFGKPREGPPIGAGLTLEEHADAVRIVAAPVPPERIVPAFWIFTFFQWSSLLATLALLVVMYLLGFLWIWLLAAILGLGQVTFVSFLLGVARSHFLEMAAKRFEIMLTPTNVRILQESGGKTTTHDLAHHQLKALREVSHEAEDSARTIERLQLITVSGGAIEILHGRPFEECQWLSKTLATRLNLPVQPQ